VSSHVLLVEDEKLVADMVQLNLQHAGFVVTHAGDGEAALERVEAHCPDVVVLDVMLPGMDGMEVARRLRAAGRRCAILMLTARGEVPARVAGLEAGADDYLTKPFAMAELVARVRALERRAATDRTEVPLRHGAEHIVAGWSVSLENREATRAGSERLVLTETEAALLGLFLAHPGQVLSRADILESAWGMDRSPTERSVDNYVMRLRRMFETDLNRPQHFLTLRGTGYRYER
jgi:two-component system, OmpR family, response regulator MprA